MDTIVCKPLPAFGFLTCLEDTQHGYFGGYLLISELGRPLEFHCSTPVKPNRAQRILYGKSLTNYIYADLIGQTLISKGQLPVQAVITDCREMLELALLCDEIIMCVDSADSAGEDGSQDSVPQFSLGKYRLFGSAMSNWVPDVQREVLLPLASHVDFLEPFQRIRDAIREAQSLNDESTDDPINGAHAA